MVAWTKGMVMKKKSSQETKQIDFRSELNVRMKEMKEYIVW
jgi:hypothetical protein